MTRLEGWESALFEALAPHMAAPFAWGASDCFLMAMDAMRAVTGEDPYGEHRGRYKTAAGAMKRIRSKGFRDLEGAMDAICERVIPSLARRGDIVSLMADDGIALGVVVGDGILCKAPAGIQINPLWTALHAWRVG